MAETGAAPPPPARPAPAAASEAATAGLEAWHLPGFGTAPASGLQGRPAARRADAWHEGRTAGGAHFRSPRLTAGEAATVAESVRRCALAGRRERDFRGVVRSLASAAGRLTDPGTSEAVQATDLLARELGWPAGLAAETLQGMAAGWTEEALLSLLEEELGDPSVLDAFVPAAARAAGAAGARRRRAAGPQLLLQVLAGNVPGVGVTGLIRGLLVRSGVLIKLPEYEPGLTVLFARLLANGDSLLGGSVAAAWWPGAGAPPVWGEWVKRSGKVVVYGGEESVRAVRAAAPPNADVVAYGPRIGVAVVFPPAAEPTEARGAPEAEEAAARLARDICAYDQQGCVSPRLVFVVGAPAAPFAGRLGRALEAEVARIPRPVPGAGVGTAIRAARAEAEFEGYGVGDAPPTVFGPPDLSWTVVSAEAAGVATEVLPRFVRVGAVRDVAELARVLAPLEGRIQAMGYAAPADGAGLLGLAEAAAELGISRLAPIGRLAWPPADWRHDGRHQLLPLLRWTDWEG